MSHTKEPWSVESDKIDWDRIVSENKEIIPNIKNSFEDLARIVLCVNACTGIDTKILCQYDYSIKAEIADLTDRINELEKLLIIAKLPIEELINHYETESWSRHRDADKSRTIQILDAINKILP